MTWNQIFYDVIMFAVVTILGFVMKQYVVPFLVNHHLVEVARVLVQAAEAIYGAGHGKDKLQYCVDQIQEKYHINVEMDVIYNAIQSAWLELDAIQSARLEIDASQYAAIKNAKEG